MMNGQMDPLAMALLARQQQGQGGATGPVLVPQQSQQMGQMMSPQAGGAPGGSMGDGIAAAGRNFADSYKRMMEMNQQAQQVDRNKLLAAALNGDVKPGVGPGGMGSMSYGGPR
ncbi:hypothetical protein [Azospirillum palustre]